MKNKIVLAGVLWAFLPGWADAALSCQAASGKLVTPVVELYTSEGCSSCPPADRWLSRQVRRTDLNANFLAFHVDYWDDIGWPDRFANHAYTERQRIRVQQKGSSTVYTPQVMLGQETRANWSLPGGVDTQIKKSNGELSSASILLSARGEDSDWKVEAQISSKAAIPGAQWYLAVYQDGLSSQVNAGENRGAVLRHDRVVRQWLGPYRLTGTNTTRNFTIKLPGPSATTQTGLLAILENPSNSQVLQSMKLPLSQCLSVSN